MTRIGVVGVPSNSAGTRAGVARAPEALRDAGLLEGLARVAPTTDHGDVSLPDPSPVRDPATHVIDPAGLAAVVEGVRDGVASILAEGHFPLVIGGDCPVLLGCLAAFGDPARRGLLFVDGHEDAYQPERSTTGEAADMELGLALGLSATPWWPAAVPSPPVVRPERVQVLGPRDAAAMAREGAASLAGRLSLVEAERVVEDPARAARAALDALPAPWWLHVDLDVLSTDALPAIDYPQPGGLAWGDLETIVAAGLGAGPVGWDVTIYNPDLDPDRIHARRIVRFLETAMQRLAAAA